MEQSLPSQLVQARNNGKGVHHRVADAVHMIWNNQYAEADAILSSQRASHPRYALEHANNFLLQMMVDYTNESLYTLLELFKAADAQATAAKHGVPMFDMRVDGETGQISEDSDLDEVKAKKLANESCKMAEKAKTCFEDTWKLECDVIYADALLMRSVCQFMTNSYFKSAINLRKAWGLYYKMMQIVEADTCNRIPEELKMCVKYGTGTFYTFLALVPAKLMKLLNVIGFISDRELGEQYLTEVFESNSIRSPFAALVLCTLYLFLPTGIGCVEETLKKAKHVLDTMNERYKHNTYFYGYANFYYRKKGQTTEALKAIQIAEANAAREEGLVPLLVRYLHADTLFMDLRFDEAKEKYNFLLDHIISLKKNFAYTGQVMLSFAACCVMLGDDDKALESLKKVRSVYNSKFKNDALSPKIAARMLANKQLLPLCGVYLLYINRDLAHMNVEQAERVLKELERVTRGKDMSGVEAENMHLLFVGTIYKGCGRIEKALEILNRIFAAEKRIPTDSMILPCAYYETGELEYRRGNIARAKELFIKGSSLKGDGNETLANRYTIALKQLKRAVEKKNSSK